MTQLQNCCLCILNVMKKLFHFMIFLPAVQNVLMFMDSFLDHFSKLTETAKDVSELSLHKRNVVLFLEDENLIETHVENLKHFYITSNRSRFECTSESEVVMVDLNPRSAVLKDNKEIHFGDCIWIFANSDANKIMIQEIGLKYDSLVYTIEISDAILIFREHFKLDIDFKENIVEKWSGSNIIFRAETVWKRRSNLNGINFKVFVKDYVPINSYGENGQPIGYTIDILNLLQSAMNFTMTYHRVDKEVFGSKLQNGSFSGLVGLLQRSEADFSATLLKFAADRAGKLIRNSKMTYFYGSVTFPQR